jgi:hypothetical protein
MLDSAFPPLFFFGWRDGPDIFLFSTFVKRFRKIVDGLRHVNENKHRTSMILRVAYLQTRTQGRLNGIRDERRLGSACASGPNERKSGGGWGEKEFATHIGRRPKRMISDTTTWTCSPLSLPPPSLQGKLTGMCRTALCAGVPSKFLLSLNPGRQCVWSNCRNIKT